MKKKNFALFFIITVLGVFLGKSVFQKEALPAKSTNEAVMAAPEHKAAQEEFELRLFEGRLFLYRFADGERYLIKSCDSPSLRENDIAALADGVKAATLSEALMLLEDFTS